MSPEDLIKEYLEAKETFEKMCKEVENYYLPLAKKALENNDIELAKKIMQECPDTVTCVFILDAIKQKEK